MIDILDVAIFSITYFPAIAVGVIISSALLEGKIRTHLKNRRT